MIKPIRVQSSKHISGSFLVLVHPNSDGRFWGYSTFNMNGGWANGTSAENNWDKQTAMKKATEHRAYLRKLHREYLAKVARRKK